MELAASIISSHTFPVFMSYSISMLSCEHCDIFPRMVSSFSITACSTENSENYKDYKIKILLITGST